MSRRVERAIFAAILVAFLALFARTCTYDYVWDDVHEIANNELFDRPLAMGLGATQMEKSEPGVMEVHDVELAYDSYRPLLFTSFWLDVQLWGRRPGPMHAVNIVLALLVIAMAYRIGRQWFGSALALIPAAIVALHPQQVEAVAYISGRGDVLAALCALVALSLALVAIDAERRRVGVVVVATIALVASLAAKESCVALPAVVLLVALARGRLRARWWVGAALAAGGLAYFALRSLVATSTSGHALGAAVASLPDVWLSYVQQAVLPFQLSSERVLHHPLGAAGWPIALVLGGGALVAIARRRSAPLVSIALGTLLLALAVAPAAVVIAMTGIAADRYAYAGMIGFGFAVAGIAAAVAARAGKYRGFVGAAGIAWALLLVVVTAAQIATWRDNLALYSHAVAMEPASSQAQYRRAYLDVLADRWDVALPRLELAIRLDGRNTRARNNLGVGLLRTGHPAEAEAALQASVDVDPAYFRSWFNLGLAHAAMHRGGEACAAFAHAVQLNPRYGLAREQLARCTVK